MKSLGLPGCTWPARWQMMSHAWGSASSSYFPTLWKQLLPLSQQNLSTAQMPPFLALRTVHTTWWYLYRLADLPEFVICAVGPSRCCYCTFALGCPWYVLQPDSFCRSFSASAPWAAVPQRSCGWVKEAWGTSGTHPKAIPDAAKATVVVAHPPVSSSWRGHVGHKRWGPAGRTPCWGERASCCFLKSPCWLLSVSRELAWGQLIIIMIVMIIMINLPYRVTFRNGVVTLLQSLWAAPLDVPSPRGVTAAGKAIFYPQSWIRMHLYGHECCSNQTPSRPWKSWGHSIEELSSISLFFPWTLTLPP